MFTVRTDRMLLSTEPSERVLGVELKLPRPEGGEARRPVHLSLVIDRSGSMAGDKLRLAIHAALQAVRSLSEGDRFSVVTFDDQIAVPVPSTEATPAARRHAETALGVVTSGGSTDLGGGWLRGCAEVSAYLPEDAIGRCLLLTDGQANNGITSPEELTRLAHEHRLRRVTTSTLGLGDGFNEFLLGRLSEEGGGNFYFAEHADQLPGFVARELGEVLSVVARDASLQIQVPEDVQVESLNDYPCTRQGHTLAFALGSLSGGLALGPMFRLRFPAGPAGQKFVVTVRLTDHDGALPKEPWTVEFVRGAEAQVDAQAPDVMVTRPAAALDAARARRAALELNRSGQRSESAARLAASAALLRSYAAGDPEIVGQAERLEEERETYSRPMSSLGMKDRYFQAMRVMKMGLSDEPAAAVLALPTHDRLVRLLQTTIQALSASRGAPTFAMDPSLRRALPPGPLAEDDERKLTAEAFALSRSAVKVVFVEQPLLDGWFSHWHASEGTAVVSIFDLNRLPVVRVESFVAYELVLYGLHALSATYTPKSMLHAETRACLFDLCRDKAEVRLKLQAGHICAACLQKLPALGLDGDAVTRLWRVVQTLAR